MAAEVQMEMKTQQQSEDKVQFLGTKRPVDDELEPEEDDGEIYGRRILEDYELEDQLFDERYLSSDESDCDTTDLRRRRAAAEFGYNDEVDPLEEQEKSGGRRMCLQVPVCHKHQHALAFDDGLPLFELFSAKLKLNKKCCTKLSGGLVGEAVTYAAEHAPRPTDYYDPYNPQPISYFHVRPEQPYPINLDDSINKRFILLPISGPYPRPPVRTGSCSFYLEFPLMLDDCDLFNLGHGLPHVNKKLFGNHIPNAVSIHIPTNYNLELRDPAILRRVLGDPNRDRALLCVHYTVYSGAWANVEVRMKGTVCSFYGDIIARACIFLSRIRLLTIKEGGRGEVDEESGCIKLMRSVVAVPSRASLIIGASLKSNEHPRVICRGRTSFVPQKSGEETKYIYYNGAESLEVRVQWNCSVTPIWRHKQPVPPHLVQETP